MSSERKPIYILDSFAMLAFLEGEVSATRVQTILTIMQQSRALVYFPVINLGEVLYITERERGLTQTQQALAAIEQLPILLLDASQTRVLAAAHIKANYPISYADAFVVAAAQEFQATIVTGNPEFAKVTQIVTVEWLAAKHAH